MLNLEIVSKLIYYIGVVIEYVGIIIVIISVADALIDLLFRKYHMDEVRTELALNVIFGLEFIIAADVLLVTVLHDINEILQLGGIVVIRVLLGYTLRSEAAKQTKKLRIKR